MSPSYAPSVFDNSVQLYDLLSKLSGSIRAVFIGLGSHATQYTDTTNSKGDRCLVGDIECERAVISYFRNLRIPCVVASEEHGVVDLTNGKTSLCTVVLDGLDGSKYAQQHPGASNYGTAVGILKGSEPCYSDAIATLFVKHGEGVSQIFSCDRATHQESGWEMFHERREDIKILIDAPVMTYSPDYARALQQAFPNYNESPSAQAFANLYQGSHDAFVRLVAHGNLELAAFSAVLSHRSACVRTISGTDMMNERYAPMLDSKELLVIGRSVEVTERVLKTLRL